MAAFKTFLCDHAPRPYLFESTITGTSIFIIYYFVRHTNVKEDVLKWVLIPAWANIIMILVQRFDSSVLPILPVAEPTGFIGNKGMAASFLAITTPIFWKYCKKGIPFLFLAFWACNGSIGFLAGIISSLVYLFITKRKMFIFGMILLTAVSAWYIPRFIDGRVGQKGETMLRLSMWARTFETSIHNPIFGWGVGSFQSVIARIPPDESEFFGVQFNTDDKGNRIIMNHPHNEVLSGWWKMGIMFPVLLFFLIGDILHKYRKELVLTFSMMVAGVVVGMGWFFKLPTLFLLILAFGIYENQRGDYG